MSRTTLPRESFAVTVQKLKPWFHNLHLPDGTQTAPDHFLGDFPSYKWQEIADVLPVDLHGWQALDIGCNAGFYSFELARRGARVTAIDMNAHYLAQARWAAGLYGLAGRIDFRQMQVYELARERQQYDLILFLGVFYHLRYPLLGLDIVAQRVRRLLVFQTLTMPGQEVFVETDNRAIDDRRAMSESGWPKMAFIEGRFAQDRTNWWAANHAGVEAMLRSSGMRLLGRPGTETYLCEPDPANPSCMLTWNRAEFAAATGWPPLGKEG
jgi:tRNA (mo5U34)-methyltransferase